MRRQLTPWVFRSFWCFCSILLCRYIFSSYVYLELLGNFALVISLLSGIHFAWFLYVRNSLGIGFSGLVLLLTAYPWINLGYGRVDVSPATTVEDSLSILQWNSYYKNHQVPEFVTALNRGSQPDLLLFQEVTPKIIEQLSPLETVYPYHCSAPQADAYGMLLLSKIPILRCQRLSFKNTSNHYSLIELNSVPSNTPLLLVESHVRSPARKHNIHHRRCELQELATLITQQPHSHKIVLGDMNTTPYSPYLRPLVQFAKLKNAMQGVRFQGTWPSCLPSFLRIPIDHLFMSENIFLMQQ